jgi:hypothetical protein
MYGINLGISKTIWKGDGIIGFNIRDIFNTRKMKNYSDNSDIPRNKCSGSQDNFLFLSPTDLNKVKR